MKNDRCPYRKPDCFAFGAYGKCIACSDTRFESCECPFYKTKAQRYKEHLLGIQKLEQENRFDLIGKYGEQENNKWIWRDIVDG